jgi:multidrug transporter EmrE-like cation transporter
MQKTVIYILIYATFNVCGAAIVKLQLKQMKLLVWKDWLNFLWNLPFLIAAACIVFSALALFKALSTEKFTLVIPMATGVNFLFTVLLGYFLFQDKLSMFSYVGFLFILTGIVLLSINNQTQV